MSASRIRAAAGEDAAAAEFYATADAEKAERERVAAERLAAYEAEHGPFQRAPRGR